MLGGVVKLPMPFVEFVCVISDRPRMRLRFTSGRSRSFGSSRQTVRGFPLGPHRFAEHPRSTPPPSPRR